MLARAVGALIRGTLHVLTGPQARWRGCGPAPEQRVYFANHASHADFALIWTVLPPRLRRTTRPVAARDYWSHGALKQFLIHRVLRGMECPKTATTRMPNSSPKCKGWSRKANL